MSATTLDPQGTSTSPVVERAIGTGKTPDEAALDDALERGRALAAQIAALQASLADVAAEIEALAGVYPGMSPRAYMAWQWHLTPAEAGRLLRISQNMPDLGKISAAFRAGELSEGVVSSLINVATVANEEALLQTAKYATGAQLQALVRDYRRGMPRDERDRRPETYNETTGDDGMVDIRVRLNPEHAAAWRAALNAARQRERADRRRPTTESNRAAPPTPAEQTPDADDAATGAAASQNSATAGPGEPSGHAPSDGPTGPSTCPPPDPTPPTEPPSTDRPHSGAADPPPTEPSHEPDTAAPTADAPPPRVSKVDALLRLASDHLETHRRRDGSLADSHQVNVHINLADLLDPLHPSAQARIEGTGAVDPRVAAMAACTERLALIFEEDGIPVRVTNPAYLPSRAQRRAVHARDKTCQGPGCDRTTGLHIHHITPWPAGPTALWNLTLVCDHHHRAVHMGRYRIIASPTSEPVWYDDRGRRVTDASRRSTTTHPTDIPDVRPRPTPPYERLDAFTADGVLLAWQSPN